MTQPQESPAVFDQIVQLPRPIAQLEFHEPNGPAQLVIGEDGCVSVMTDHQIAQDD